MAQEHLPGSMDIKVQQKTFAAFVKVSVRFSIAVAIFFVLLAMWNA